MQVKFTVADKQIIKAAADTTGGTLSEIRMYDKIAANLNLDEVETDAMANTDESPMNFELDRDQIALIVSIIDRSKTWTFSARKGILKLTDRLRGLYKE